MRELLKPLDFLLQKLEAFDSNRTEQIYSEIKFLSLGTGLGSEVRLTHRTSDACFGKIPSRTWWHTMQNSRPHSHFYPESWLSISLCMVIMGNFLGTFRPF